MTYKKYLKYISLFYILYPLHPLSAIDLKLLVNQTISTNPEIISKKKEYESALYDLQMSRSAYYPKLDIKGSKGIEEANSQLTGYVNRELKTTNGSVTLSQNLFAGFSTYHDVAVKELKLEARKQAVLEQINDSVLKLSKSYLDTLKAYEILNIEKENAKVHEKIYKDFQKRIEGGSGRISDYEEVLAKLALSYSNLLAQENNYQDALTELHKVLGKYVDGKDLHFPTHNLEIPDSFEKAIVEALNSNPSIKITRYEIEASKNAMKLDRNSFYPKIDAEINAHNYQNSGGMPGENKSTAGLVTLSWNLYNGGYDQSKLKKSLTAVESSIEKLHILEREIIENMGLSYNAYTSLSKQKEFLTLYEKSSKKKASYYHDEFDLGRRSLIDMLNADDDYYAARKKVLENEYALLYAKYRVLDSKNTLLDAFGIFFDSDNALKTNQKYSLQEEDVEKTHQTVICQNTKDENSGNFGCSILPTILNYPFLDTNKSFNFSSQSTESTKNIVQSHKDQKKALFWFEKAAALGDKKSIENIIKIYENGFDAANKDNKIQYWKQRIPSDNTFSEATQYFDEAIKLINDNNTSIPSIASYHLLAQAARLNHAKAQFMLAEIYEQGKIIKKDINKAFIWYRESARHNYIPAYPIVAAFYKEGKSIPVDDVKSDFWQQKYLNESKKDNSIPEDRMVDENISENDVLKKYENEANLNNPIACYKLGMYYYQSAKSTISLPRKITPFIETIVGDNHQEIIINQEKNYRYKSFQERLKDLGISIDSSILNESMNPLKSAPPPLVIINKTSKATQKGK